MNRQKYGTKISVCIPVYNWDIRPLIQRLKKELDSESWGKYVEIIIMDDSSVEQDLKTVNREFIFDMKFENLKYAELTQNIGRTKIRNLLAEKARGEYLLFLDSDVMPDQNNFVRRYFEYAAENKWDVLCGGCSYGNRVTTGKEYDFCFYLGKKTEAKPANIRNRKPWQYLLTSNVMVRKSCFMETNFDERFSVYGHEDTEWGIRLTKRFRVLHINNTVSHLGLVSKEVAYRKMRQSIKNYVLLAKLHSDAFQESNIYDVVKWLMFLDDSLLEITDALLRKMFFCISNEKLCFPIFQFNKAVLFAKEFKKVNDIK